MTWKLLEGDCLEVLASIPDGSIDAVITDPPYSEIDREYGRWTEAEWWALMVDGVIPHVRRVLKPAGSAVFILQPNSRKVGSMRGWLWEFMAWCCREWNMVQDAYWWNHTAMPMAGATERGLMRPSIKPCVWLGNPDCHRNQDEVLWAEADQTKAIRLSGRASNYSSPSNRRSETERPRKNGLRLVAAKRGGVTPFNCIPMSTGTGEAGAHGHGAGTPLALMRWWTRYICPPDGTILDPFAGSGTAGVAAHMECRNSIMVERIPKYCDIIRKRMAEAEAKTATPLFDTKEDRP